MPCTVEIEKTSESLHAHVVLDGDIDIRPGDEVIVHGAPTEVAFGETLERAPHGHGHARRLPLERLWTRIEGYLEFTELYEVSFSDRRHDYERGTRSRDRAGNETTAPRPARTRSSARASTPPISTRWTARRQLRSARNGTS